MAEFLEERISTQLRYDNSYTDDYAVEITQTGGSNNVQAQEYRRLVHPYPIRRFSISYQLERDELQDSILNLYHRAYGKFAGFRAKNFDDFTTAVNHRDAPSGLDQTLTLVTTGVYQLRKRYGTDKAGITVGFPERTIYKPVANTTLIGVAGLLVPASGYTVNTTDGKATFAANKTATITAITKAANAVISCAGHTFVANETVHISGVVGMTQINGLRGQIVSVVAGVSITVNINSTGFGTYTSGGVLNTRPQAGEAVTGGCEFDFPVRFDGAISVVQNHKTSRSVSFELVELLNP